MNSSGPHPEQVPPIHPPQGQRPEIAVLAEDAQVRALSHPERARILNYLVEREATAAQVADALGSTRGGTHYHIRELHKARLVEIVSREERGAGLEKYYRATARNFCLAHGIGEHLGLTADVQDMINESMLGWRRQQVLQVDPQMIAQRIIVDCLATRPDQIVLIQGGNGQREMIEALTRALDVVGAHGIVHYRCGRIPTFLTRWKDDLHAVIALDVPVDRFTKGGGLPDSETDAATRGLEVDRLAALAVTFAHASVPGDPLDQPVNRELIEAGIRTIFLGCPTVEHARRLGIEYRTLHDAFWTALDVDYAALARECELIARRLECGREAHLRSPGGTDLRFGLGGREVFVDDGVISEWEVARRRCWNHLPAGKVLVAAAKGTAEGILHAEIADYLGISIRGIRIAFHHGEIVAATADENEDLLRRLLEAGQGDARQLASLELGMNPRIQNAIGYSIWDSKSYGDASIGLGENRLIGGSNVSDFAWSMRVTAPRIQIDGAVILEHREYRWVAHDAAPE
jgi:leucyl aminopeptidase (aminopeptidase T)/DNA-binding transcriptional ArsR family regulator